MTLWREKTLFAEFVGLQKTLELIDCHACLADDSSQSSTIQFSMIRNNDLGERILAAEYHMASMLPQYCESGSGQRFRAGLS
jgi:hypothetical protein